GIRKHRRVAPILLRASVPAVAPARSVWLAGSRGGRVDNTSGSTGGEGGAENGRSGGNGAAAQSRGSPEARGGGRRSDAPRRPRRAGTGRARPAGRRVGSPAGAGLARVRQRRRPVDVRAVREEVPEQQAAVHRHDERGGRPREVPC